MSESLIECIMSRDVEAAERLLQTKPDCAMEVNLDGISAAMLALYYEYPEIGRKALSLQNSLSVFDAAAFGLTQELSKLACEGEINIFSVDGFTPLHLAAYFGHEEAVDLLIAKKANIELLSKNGLGVTPLHSALSNRHEHVARILVFEGANVNSASSTGWTPLHYAAYQGNRPLGLFLKEHGALSVAGPTGKTPAEIAKEAGHTDILDIL
jgi:ankyrin repeat protein